MIFTLSSCLDSFLPELRCEEYQLITCEMTFLSERSYPEDNSHMCKHAENNCDSKLKEMIELT